MYSLFIQNASSTKNKVHSLNFPGLAEIGEPPVTVRAICVDGEFLFHVVDIIFTITKYEYGRTGNTLVHVRDSITSNGGRDGFGKVFWFRRGVYADIRALQSISRAMLSDAEDACEYAKISYHAAFEALLSCDVQQYQSKPVPAKLQYACGDFVQILPGSLSVSRVKVCGTPITPDYAEDGDSCEDEAFPAESEEIESGKPINPEKALAAPITELYAFDKLLSLLVGGRKLVLTLEVK